MCRIINIFPAHLEEDNEIDLNHSKSKYPDPTLIPVPVGYSTCTTMICRNL